MLIRYCCPLKSLNVLWIIANKTNKQTHRMPFNVVVFHESLCTLIFKHFYSYFGLACSSLTKIISVNTGILIGLNIGNSNDPPRKYCILDVIKRHKNQSRLVKTWSKLVKTG